MEEVYFYIGHKPINAKPMTRQEYNDFRGWTLPADENGEDEGYLVEYIGAGQKPNTDVYKGYVSWSPKAVFEAAYRPNGGLAFGDAIELMKAGHKMARSGWNGNGMWVIYNPGSKGETHSMYEGSVYKNHGVNECEILPHFDMYTVNAHGRRAMLPGWLASQSDMDATDWCIVD